MAKDPAVLFYIDKWLVSTKEMKSKDKGWYLNLILYQFDKGSIPSDIEELANLCDVRFSEFEEFKQVFEHVLKYKFKDNGKGRLENDFAKEIIKKRGDFKDKQSQAGITSYIMKYLRENFTYPVGFEEYFKNNIPNDFDHKNKQVFEQVFKQVFERYVKPILNVNKDININSNSSNNTITEISKKIALPFKFSDIPNELKNNSQTKEFCIKTYKIKENQYSEFIDFFIGLNSDHSENEIVDFKEWNKHFKEWMKFNYDKLPQQKEQRPKINIL